MPELTPERLDSLERRARDSRWTMAPHETVASPAPPLADEVLDLIAAMRQAWAERDDARTERDAWQRNAAEWQSWVNSLRDEAEVLRKRPLRETADRLASERDALAEEARALREAAEGVRPASDGRCGYCEEYVDPRMDALLRVLSGPQSAHAKLAAARKEVVEAERAYDACPPNVRVEVWGPIAIRRRAAWNALADAEREAEVRADG